MRRTTRIATGFMTLALAVSAPGAPVPGEQDGSDIALLPIKYRDLCKTIRGFKGKVVIVDFWAEY
jgi:hypothetical protein